jgi:hypothetical protein
MGLFHGFEKIGSDMLTNPWGATADGAPAGVRPRRDLSNEGYSLVAVTAMSGITGSSSVCRQ